ncbi:MULTISPECIES: 3-dehydroquinate synthase [Paenibacillus]|uniref:3-dehydroquinate synthase n=1 Tax=Paenibacillus campinasensis TaxID=66347 RepID=A0A268F2Y7_9BACL|nr:MULTISPECIES: 3-dehydroquinate synthase [Paenibacillus]MUG65008.1 3-dehydroquinate synthase [Paenibacillus campinasensis]PAD79721.1 3-dehydroquinate synthase [Paenibacillus campinasensis]PAK53584.1 3-dehydroquinate synthase [Paenibacillus sp. 7541]
MRTLHVELGERSYPIYIGSGLLERLGELSIARGINRNSTHLIVTDDKVAPHYLQQAEETLAAAGYSVISHIVPAGESSKSLQTFEEVMTTAIQGGLDRSSAVFALGGGVVGDLAGFVAATYMRGVTFVQIPTTILAHDSSVGGKVAVNHPLAKNMIGAFHQPVMVLYDVNTLLTLPPRDISAGLSEMVKHGLILDRDFAYWCRDHAADLLRLDPEALSYGLERGCAIKADVVSKDEREGGLRAILNLGHTIGHAIEAVGDYGRFLHGEAISIGMAGSAMLAEKLGRDKGIYEETVSMLKALNLPVTLPPDVSVDDIMAAMQHDKKFTEGRMVFIVPEAIGAVSIVKDVPVDAVRCVVEMLKGESV